MANDYRKRLNEHRKHLEQRGWTAERTGSGHWRFRGPSGATVFAPFSASDWRSLRNVRRDLRQAGVTDLPAL